MYKYLLWDIDGTVLDFLAAEAYAIKKLFLKYGFGECSEEMLRTYSTLNARYWAALERGEMTKQQLLVGRFREFFTLMGWDPALAEPFNAEYQLTLGDCIVFVPGAQQVLLDVRGKYTLIAVTNGTAAAQRKKLRQSGLENVFDAVFISEEVGCEKPDPAFFAHVFRAAGITQKNEVLVIGDSLTGDMRGGQNAGVDTCWYNPHHAPNPDAIPVTYEVDSIAKVPSLLAAPQK